MANRRRENPETVWSWRSSSKLTSSFLLAAEGWRMVDQVFGAAVVQIGVGPGTTGCPLSPALPGQRGGYSYPTTSGTRGIGRRLAWQSGPAYSELSWYSSAVTDTRRKALTDAVTHGRDSGAHGVVGLSGSWQELSLGVYRATWQGQAVCHPASEPLSRPFSTTLAGANLAKLLQCGYTPVGTVVSFSAVHVHSWATQVFGTKRIRSNVELPSMAAALSLARHAVLRGLRDDPAGAGAEIVVGLDLRVSVEPHGCAAGGEGRLITASAVGSAASCFGPPRQRDPELALALSDARRIPGGET